MSDDGLERRTEALTEAIERAEARLGMISKGCPARIPFVRAAVLRERFLAYERHTGGWGLYIIDGDVATRLTHCARLDRCRATRCLQDLVAAINEAQLAMSVELDCAVSRIERFLEEHSG